MNILPLINRPATLPKVIFTDVDDTLTWQGRLPVETLSALYQLKEQGIMVVPLTGGCAGWCDCIIRTWPVDFVIGENGSFYLARSDDGKVSWHYVLDTATRMANNKHLKSVSDEFCHVFTDIPTTADQAFRKTDIAFDIGQENSVSQDRALQALEWLKQQGVQAKKSSIHINAWLGNYNKALGALHWLKTSAQHCKGLDNITPDDCLFIGDSANDESMFETFADTVGVANIATVLPELQYKPEYMTQASGGFGFVELANQLLSL